MKIDFNTVEILKYQIWLEKVSKTAVPFAIRSTLDGGGFTAQKFAKANVKESFVNRNKFSQKSIVVDKAKSLDMNTMQTVVGSTADYMETQEFGGIKTSKDKTFVPIATSYSAGLPQNAKPRTRLTRSANKLKNIRIPPTRNIGKSKRQRNFLRIKFAAESGHKFVFLDLGQRQGIFRVLGSKKRRKVKMVADLSRTSVKIPRHPWLLPAVDKTRPLMPDIYVESLKFQIKRIKLFKSK